MIQEEALQLVINIVGIAFLLSVSFALFLAFFGKK